MPKAVGHYQLLSGNELTAVALKKLGWAESGQCWWVRRGRQTREHLFKGVPGVEEADQGALGRGMTDVGQKWRPRIGSGKELEEQEGIWVPGQALRR